MINVYIYHLKRIEEDKKRLELIYNELGCKIFVIWEDLNGTNRIECFKS